MKIIIVPRRGIERIVQQVIQTFQEFNLQYTVNINPTPEEFKAADIALVIGGDGDVLRTFHNFGGESIPLLGVNDSNSESFLTETGVSKIREIVKKLLHSDYKVEDVPRLKVLADNKELPPALNEIALFPTRSATLMEYLLKVDREPIWRDYADGLILATPTGATAYAMSAGGPMVHSEAQVFVLVPVNSVDVTHRPLVVPSTSVIEVSEISSRYECDAIVDGVLRTKVRREIQVTKASLPARLIRFPEVFAIREKMTRKVRLAEELQQMPPSAKLVLKTLEYEGPLSQKDIAIKTMLPDRTTRLALSLLLNKGLIKRQQSLRDARHSLYQVA